MRAKIGGAESHGFAERVKRVCGPTRKEAEPIEQTSFFITVMDRPVRLAVVFALGLFAPWRLGAEELAAAVGKPTEGTPATKSERAISPRTAALLAVGLPKYEPPKPAEKKPEAGPLVAGEGDRPSNAILRLPKMIVREPRVLSPEDVRSPRELEIYAMNKYLGPKDGFSRGVLNHFTFAEAWKNTVKHVPILNRFEWFSSPEKTAVDMYYDDEVRKKMRDLMGLTSVPTKPAAPAPTVDGEK